ncbi:hypothetical protein GGD68_004231 [Paraburkholderia fungorum]|jgi:hypothetical protein|uniref:Uncharacterized protein n=1 Tax=Paraburkholderia fungorum TaxID=134537 RepID=A0AAW3UXL3_9BURK|nr:hypothetical protein [Paraburkholderia fungorum]MBB6203390.1 hypothetical protein [Paraburkholderia fungorum]
MRGSQNAAHEQERAEHLRREPTLSPVCMVAKGRPHFDFACPEQSAGRQIIKCNAANTTYQH